jgi:hypothetical protein
MRRQRHHDDAHPRGGEHQGTAAERMLRQGQISIGACRYLLLFDRVLMVPVDRISHWRQTCR